MNVFVFCCTTRKLAERLKVILREPAGVVKDCLLISRSEHAFETIDKSGEVVTKKDTSWHIQIDSSKIPEKYLLGDSPESLAKENANALGSYCDGFLRAERDMRKAEKAKRAKELQGRRRVLRTKGSV